MTAPRHRAPGGIGKVLIADIARLATLVPKPRVHLTRDHGVFAPNSQPRALVMPAKRGKGHKPKALDEAREQTPAERRASMTWAERLKRVFHIDIDIETCRACAGAGRIAAPAHLCARGISATMHVIAGIEDPVVIKKILTHLKEKAASVGAGL
jgi:hypothetical protein